MMSPSAFEAVAGATGPSGADATAVYGDPVTIAKGGTGQTTAAAALAALGGQPLDSDLTAIAALTTTSFGRAFLALADVAAAFTALGLGTAATHATGDYQPIDSDLTAIAALTTTSFGRAVLALADAAALRTAAGLGGAAVLNVGTGAGTVMAGDDARWQPVDSDLTAIAALTTTSYGRAFLALADAAAARTALALGTAATAATGDFDAAGAAASAQSASQPLDTDLTTIAGLTATTDSFLQSKASAWAARTIAQVKTDLAISNVTNTSDANKPVSTAQQTALDLKANLASPTFTGTVTAGTTSLGATTSQLAGAPVSKTVDYTLVLGDASFLIVTSKATAIALTIPANASVAFPVGTIIYFYNAGAGTMTLGITSDTLTGSTSYATGAGGYLIKRTSTTWIVFKTA